MFEKGNDSREMCISTQCIEGDVKKCIKEQEMCAFSRNKSLIILTGARLRLGISLPCCDIAIHMDPIENVDTIYQSMFRVLTGYEGKKRGFFVDLLKERLIKFVYQYDNYTNKLNKKRVDLKKQKQNIKQRLVSWNFNGINNFEDDSKNCGKIYSKLSNSFSLNDNKKFYENVENYQQNTNVKRVLEFIPISQLKNIYKNLEDIIDLKEKKSKKKKNTIELLSSSCSGLKSVEHQKMKLINVRVNLDVLII